MLIMLLERKIHDLLNANAEWYTVFSLILVAKIIQVRNRF
jgi:hypothetical protein